MSDVIIFLRHVEHDLWRRMKLLGGTDLNKG